MFKTIILYAIVVAGALALQGEAASEPYSYHYETDSHGASESKDANGQVTGFYTIAEADGRQRRVDYVADAGGFRAKVQTNEVGTKSENPADVEVLASPPTREQYAQGGPNYQPYASQFAVQPQGRRVVSHHVPQRSAVYGSYQATAADGSDSNINSAGYGGYQEIAAVPSSKVVNPAAYSGYQATAADGSGSNVNSAGYGGYQETAAVPSSKVVNPAAHGLYHPYNSGAYGANNGYSAGYPVADAANYKTVPYATQLAVPAAQYTRSVAVPAATTATNHRYQTVPDGGYQSVGNYYNGHLVGERQAAYQYSPPPAPSASSSHVYN